MIRMLALVFRYCHAYKDNDWDWGGGGIEAGLRG